MSGVKTNWLDDLVGYFSPMAGVRRLQGRLAQEHFRAYEAAARGRRTDGWKSPSGKSANAEIGASLSSVRGRVRDLVRNNTHSARAVDLLQGYIVGEGIRPGISNPNEKAKTEIRSRFIDWADSTDCDVDGLNSYYGLQALAARTVAEGGEVLIIRRWRKRSDGFKLPVPMQLQLLEGDFIDHTKEGSAANDGFIIQGVEFDRHSRRVAYWLFDKHPGELTYTGRNSFVSKRVPANDIQHLFRVDRQGQVRGMSWGSPCVIKTRDHDEFEDFQLLRQKIAAAFAGFIQDQEGAESLTDAKTKAPTKIEGGGLYVLPTGKTVVFPNLPQVANDGHPERVLRSMAMGWGVTYESLTGDFRGVNYSSGRLGRLDFKKNVGRWQWHMFIPRFCTPTFRWFLEAAEIGHGVDTQGTSALWTPPRFETIDPTKEIPAIIAEIRGGLKSYPEAVRENGYDYEDHMKEIKESNEQLDKLGITLDSDPRKTQKAGGLQQQPQEDPAETVQE